MGKSFLGEKREKRFEAKTRFGIKCLTHMGLSLIPTIRVIPYFLPRDYLLKRLGLETGRMDLFPPEILTRRLRAANPNHSMTGKEVRQRFRLRSFCARFCLHGIAISNIQHFWFFRKPFSKNSINGQFYQSQQILPPRFWIGSAPFISEGLSICYLIPVNRVNNTSMPRWKNSPSIGILCSKCWFTMRRQRCLR